MKSKRLLHVIQTEGKNSLTGKCVPLSPGNFLPRQRRQLEMSYGQLCFSVNAFKKIIVREEFDLSID